MPSLNSVPFELQETQVEEPELLPVTPQRPGPSGLAKPLQQTCGEKETLTTAELETPPKPRQELLPQQTKVTSKRQIDRHAQGLHPAPSPKRQKAGPVPLFLPQSSRQQSSKPSCQQVIRGDAQVEVAGKAHHGLFQLWEQFLGEQQSSHEAPSRVSDIAGHSCRAHGGLPRCHGERARESSEAGLALGRVLKHIIGDVPKRFTGAFTMKEELREFAEAMSDVQFATGLACTPEETMRAASHVWKRFGGVTGYAAYLEDRLQLLACDVPLAGVAAWQRMLCELEVSLSQASLSDEELDKLKHAQVQLRGVHAHGRANWAEITSKLMFSVALKPLRAHVCYIAARVMWALRQLKTVVTNCIETVDEHGLAAKLYPPHLLQQFAVLRSSPIKQQLVFGAFDAAAAAFAGRIVRILDNVVVAGCTNPQILLLPRTQPTLDMTDVIALCNAGSQRSRLCRERVAAEMQLRRQAGRLPGRAPDRDLQLAFAVLADQLRAQALACAGTGLDDFCRRDLEIAMCALEPSSEHRQQAGASR
eukprot:TRINITY_DN18976_c0_g1_i2.p1 TRINITY_DN18976_c0_g1~~TRINITY_DN18976_c0_g1_i2.p1  ORF type:complete len:551 (+),score=106.93 TRINITY_DN18976_c0_g1_i2:57-1655(+)